MDGAVLVLNQNYEPLNVCNLPRAFRLVFGEKAEVVEYDHQMIRTPRQEFRAPSVIRLQHHIRRPRPRVKLTRREIFARDGHRCQYCGLAAESIDHVLPRSRGGMHAWDNVVAACRRCNTRKEDRLPHEVGLVLRTQPAAPRQRVWLLAMTGGTRDEWAPYLGEQSLTA